MISWEEYIESNISQFRKEFNRYGEVIKRIIEKDELISTISLNEPCQVVIFDFKEHAKCLIILHDKRKPDMEIVALEKSPKDFALETLEKVELLESFDSADIKDIMHMMAMGITALGRCYFDSSISLAPPTAGKTSWSFLPFNKGSIFFFEGFDPRIVGKFFFSDYLLRRIEIRSHSIEIAETAGDIKKKAEEIPAKELRTKIIEAADLIEKKIEPLYGKYEKLESDVVEVRKLVGTRGFGEWKALVADIEYLKKRVDDVSDIKESYKEVLDHQTKVLDNQAEVLKQQSDFVSWIKYSAILVPIAVACVPIIETLIRHFMGSS